MHIKAFNEIRAHKSIIRELGKVFTAFRKMSKILKNVWINDFLLELQKSKLKLWRINIPTVSIISNSSIFFPIKYEC